MTALMKYAFVHDDCGMPGFLYEDWPGLGDGMRSEKGLLLDGTTPRPLTEIVCGSCGKPIKFPGVLSLRYCLLPITCLSVEQRAKLPAAYQGSVH